jgi:hypothetical protein
MKTNIRETYTQWAIKYPWHVGGNQTYQYPYDEKGTCICQCEGCLKKGTHPATTHAHMS